MVVIGSNFSRYFIYFFLSYYTLFEINRFVFNQNKILIKIPIIEYFFDYFFVIFITIFFFNNLKLYKYLEKFKKFLKLYFFYFFYIVIFGLFSYDNNYWDYKYIFIHYIPFIFFVTTFIFGLEPENLKIITNFYSKIIFPLTAILFVLVNIRYPELISRMLIPLSFFIIFFYYLKNIQKIMILFLSIVIVFFDQSLRINILNIIVSYLLLFFFYLNIKNKKIYFLLYFIIIITPLILILLSLILNFDVFYFFNNILTSKISSSNLDLIANTRSFLYIEVYNSLNNLYEFVFGKGANASYASFAFQNSSIVFEQGRFSSEVGFLNFILKSGIFGFILFSTIFIYPSYLGIKYSNNIISKILSLKLIIYWFLLFVEYYHSINISYFFIFFISGLLLSKKLRDYSDDEISSIFINKNNFVPNVTLKN